MSLATEAALQEEINKLRLLVRCARKMLEGCEWLDDRGRECAWCYATRHTFNTEETIGTPQEHKPRDNHREDCAWHTFWKASEGI